MQFPYTDVLVIGSGLAGLYASIRCRKQGLRVCLCSKSQPGRGSCSALSQGIFRTSTASFSPVKHKHLTLKAGKGLNQSERLDTLIKNAAHDVQMLQELDVDLRYGKTGYYTKPDRLGREGLCITKPLTEYARSIGVELHYPFFAWRIAEKKGRAAGAWGFYPGVNTPVLLASRCVILATGGAGALFLHTDNPQGMIGDGYAMALASGLPLIDMEFVQFYPLCMGKGRSKRLLPPLFGEVGKLENNRGEDLVSKYDIQQRPVAVAARDSLCQAMAQELKAGLGFSDGSLRLQIHQESSFWLNARDVFGLESVDSLKSKAESLASANQGSIPVGPAAHFCMGGVAPVRNVETNLRGLFVAGEVAGGLHGANRYGGNALSEAAVFGKIAAKEAFQAVRNLPDLSWSRLKPTDTVNPSPSSSRILSISETRVRLQELMWHKAGILRSEESLSQALQELDCLRSWQAQPSTNSGSIQKELELQNMLQVSEAILRSSLERKESRGSHYRIDHPRKDDALKKHILVQSTEKGIKVI